MRFELKSKAIAASDFGLRDSCLVERSKIEAAGSTMKYPLAEAKTSRARQQEAHKDLVYWEQLLERERLNDLIIATQDKSPQSALKIAAQHYYLLRRNISA